MACQISGMICANTGVGWDVKQVGAEYRQQDMPSQNSRGGFKDKFASPFAASGVQAAEMSRDFLPSNLPTSRCGESHSNSHPCCQALDTGLANLLSGFPISLFLSVHLLDNLLGCQRQLEGGIRF